MTETSILRASSHDYLSNPAVAAYFVAREHEVYYRSLKSVDERRAFHDQLKTVLFDFLRHSDESVLPILDEIIGRAAHIASVAIPEHSDPLHRARSLEPRGVELLQIESELDFEILRSAYRHAALQHHPDRGGSDADMAAINHAYELLHITLADQVDGEPAEFAEFWVGPKTGRDYLYITTRLLFDVAFDDWALDDASALLGEMTGNLLALTTFDQANQLIGLIPASSKLVERLVAAGLTAEAGRALETARCGLESARKRDLLYEGVFNQASEVIAGLRKPRFVLNHVRQIENAYRLGAINEKRYAANLRRVQVKSAHLESERRARRELLTETRFVEVLPADARIKRDSKGSTAQLVPQPGYFQVRADDLSTDQQVEYVKTFTPPHELELVEKYAFVRLSSLLRSAIFSPDAIEPISLAAEAHQLETLEPKTGWYASQIEEILRYFTKLEAPEQRAYAGELAKLLQPEPTTIRGRMLTITIGGGLGYEFGRQFLEDAVAAGRRRVDR